MVIKDLKIEAFRGVLDLKLENLGEINILAGINNSGKTSVLEAIRLLESPLDVFNAVRVSRQREYPGPFFAIRGRHGYLESFINMFNLSEDGVNVIALSGRTNGHEFSLKFEGSIEKRLIEIEENKKKLKDREIYNIETSEMITGEVDSFSGEIQYVEDGKEYKENVSFSQLDNLSEDKSKKRSVNIVYLSPISHIFWGEPLFKTIKEGFKSEIVKLLRIFDPQIKGFEVIKDIPYIEHEALRPMPLSTYGDGLKKVLLFATSIIQAKDGILLIDEIETAIHISAFKKIFDWFVRSCRDYNVQVFGATHSQEAIDAILNSSKNNKQLIYEDDPLRIITLKKQTNKTFARILTGKEALKSRNEFDMELR
ncbi:MAG: AAA family ATPase [Firmicutes bacterium]|nr:AAA family ATPase [Bacillota bacterium]